jgi:hypothetical protein
LAEELGQELVCRSLLVVRLAEVKFEGQRFHGAKISARGILKTVLWGRRTENENFEIEHVDGSELVLGV